MKEKSAIWEIIQSIPELAHLSSDRKDDALNFIAIKLDKLSLKINASPFEPMRNGGRFHLNDNFPQAVLHWLGQFNEEHRLGFLAAMLSMIYVTKTELETLLDICVRKFDQEREMLFEKWDNKFHVSKGLFSTERNKVMYSLSETSISEAIKQTAHFSYSKDNKPTEGLLINLLETVFFHLRMLADKADHIKEYKEEEHFPITSRILNKLIRSDILIIEDCSYSGTTIKSDIKKLIALIQIVFIPYEKILTLDPVNIPHFYILLPICSNVALKEINELLSEDRQIGKYFSCVATGYVFDSSYRFSPTSLPSNIKHLSHILPALKLHDKVLDSLKYFHDKYSKDYWSEELLERTKMSSEDMLFGYRGGGWAICTFHNCPNNSLPLFWYPNYPRELSEVEALFKRNEHRSKHDPSTSNAINLNISIARKDEARELKYYLDLFYEKYK